MENKPGSERPVLEPCLRPEPEVNGRTAHLQQGLFFSQKGDFERAIVEFTACLASVYLHRASLLAKMGQHEAALADCEQVLQHEADSGRVYALRGRIYLQIGRHAQAVADFTRALAMDPKGARLYKDRGLAHARNGKLEAGLADLSRAIQLEPHYASAHAARGALLQQKGEHPQALRDFTQAVLLDPKYASAYCLQLGMAHAAQGRFELAAADYTVALLVEPANAKARLAREEARQKGREQPPPVLPTTASRRPRANPRTEKTEPPAPEKIISKNTQVSRAPKTIPDISLAKAQEISKEGKDNFSPDPPVSHALEKSSLLPESAEAEEDDELRITPTPEEEEAYEREQELLRKKERLERQESQRIQMRLQMEIQGLQEKEAGRKPAPPAPRKPTPKVQDDEDAERLPWWKKAALAAGILIGLWLGSSWFKGWYQNYQARAPLTVAKVCQDFSTNPDKALRKYGGNTFEVTGKVRTVEVQKNSRVVFENNETDGLAFECLFSTGQEVRKYRPGQELTVEGECYPRKDKGQTCIVLTECVVRKANQ